MEIIMELTTVIMLTMNTMLLMIPVLLVNEVVVETMLLSTLDPLLLLERGVLTRS